MDTDGTDIVVAQAKLLEGHEVCEVGSQRFGTFRAHSVAIEAQLLDAGELVQLGAKGRCSLG